MVSYMLVLYSENFILSGLMSKSFTLIALIIIAITTFVSLLILFKVVDYKMLKNKNINNLFRGLSSG